MDNSKKAYTLMGSPWFVWLLGASFFFLEYVIRLSPSIMVKELMHDFNTTALGLGVLSVGFHYTYLGMQLPVGVLVDRYGSRTLLPFMCVISAAGAFLFASSPNLYVAQFARLILGFGTAFAFVGTLKLCSTCFPMQKFALLAGLTQAMGMLGAAVGEGPMSLVVSSVGWRQYIVLTGCAFIALAILMTISLRQALPVHESVETSEKSSNILLGLKSVMKNKLSWIMMLYAGFIYAPTAAFAELWGATYFETAFHMNKHMAAECVSLMFLGWFLGAPSIGFFSELFNNHRRYIMLISASCGLIIFSLLLTFTQMPTWLVMTLAFLYGYTNTGLIIAYAAAGYVNERRFTGTALGFANIASVIIGVCLQPLIGWLLDLTWDGKYDALGNHAFSEGALRLSLVSMPICFIVALLIAIFFIREPHLHERK